jgi:hypothetical protein
MKKFTELNLEQARVVNDGVKGATLLSVTGACGGGGNVVSVSTSSSQVRTGMGSATCIKHNRNDVQCGKKTTAATSFCRGHLFIIVNFGWLL